MKAGAHEQANSNAKREAKRRVLFLGQGRRAARAAQPPGCVPSGQRKRRELRLGPAGPLPLGVFVDLGPLLLKS